jgi:predicted RNase H-like HicB family nuclease
MHRFLILREKAGKNFSTYLPDLPGCVTTGKTRENAEEQMHEVIAMHIRFLNTVYRFRNHIRLRLSLPSGPNNFS